MIGWSLRGVLLPLAFPAKIKRNHLKTIGLRIRLRFFYSSTQMELNKKNLNPPEGYCIIFRIPERNSDLAQPKKKRKRKKERNRRK